MDQAGDNLIRLPQYNNNRSQMINIIQRILIIVFFIVLGSCIEVYSQGSCNTIIELQNQDLNHVYSVTLPALLTHHYFNLCFTYQQQPASQSHKYSQNSSTFFNQINRFKSKFVRIDYSPNRCIQAKNDNELKLINQKNLSFKSVVQVRQSCQSLTGVNSPIFIVYQFRQGIKVGEFPLYLEFIPVIICIAAITILSTVIVIKFPLFLNEYANQSKKRKQQQIQQGQQKKKHQ